ARHRERVHRVIDQRRRVVAIAYKRADAIEPHKTKPRAEPQITIGRLRDRADTVLRQAAIHSPLTDAEQTVVICGGDSSRLRQRNGGHAGKGKPKRERSSDSAIAHAVVITTMDSGLTEPRFRRCSCAVMALLQQRALPGAWISGVSRVY